MTAAALARDGDPPALAAIGESLRGIARNLADIAANVSSEAAEATDSVRRSAEEARETALLAAEMLAIADQVADAMRRQTTLLEAARVATEASGVTIEALDTAADGIGHITQLISGIAGNSRLLALNARIEAARAGEAGRGFDVVANAVKSLSQQTWDATRDIETRTAALQDHVGQTRALIADLGDATERQGDIGSEIAAAVRRQHEASGDVARRTAATVEGIDDAASAIGRVASAAMAVDVLARQVVRAADTIGRAA